MGMMRLLWLSLFRLLQYGSGMYNGVRVSKGLWWKVMSPALLVDLVDEVEVAEEATLELCLLVGVVMCLIC